MWSLNQEYLRTSDCQKQGGKSKEQLTVYLPCFPYCFPNCLVLITTGNWVTVYMAHWSDWVQKFLCLYAVASIFKSVLTDLLQPLLIPSVHGPMHQGRVSRIVQPRPWPTLFVWKGSGQETNTEKGSLMEALASDHGVLWCSSLQALWDGVLRSWATLAPFNPHQGL